MEKNFGWKKIWVGQKFDLKKFLVGKSFGQKKVLVGKKLTSQEKITPSRRKVFGGGDCGVGWC